MLREQEEAFEGSQDALGAEFNENPTSASREMDNILEPIDGELTLLTGDEEFENSIDVETLSAEAREERRLWKKPTIKHLQDGTAVVEDGSTIPLFDVGDRIVVERNLPWSPGRWLDTRVYVVRHIDDETGVVRCFDEEQGHNAFVGYKDETQIIKLAIRQGNPFTAQYAREAKKIIKQQEKQSNKVPGSPGRGRPKGTKNRSKEERDAAKLELAKEKAERNARRLAKRGTRGGSK